MTALPNWEVLGQSDSDADLARASAAGDRRAFAKIYDRYADRLHDFCAGMLGDRDAAADCVQDAFCIVATRMPQLRDPDKLRPWLYSIARNEALRRIRDRRREMPSDDLPETMSGDPSPETLAARTELADLIADAAGGLSDRDRSVLELAFRHGLDGPELAEALGVKPANANQLVHRLRETIERSLGALLVSRRAQNNNDCAELAAILEGWDGHFNVLMRKRISRHIESCNTCDEERRRLVSPAALLGAAPVFIPAPAWLRDSTLSKVQLTSADSPIRPEDREHRAHARSSHGYLLPVALFIAALIATTSAVVFWLSQKTVEIAPTEISTTTPTPAPPPPNPPPTASVTTSAAPVAPPTREPVAPPTSPPSASASASASEPPVAEPPVTPPVAEPPPPPPEEPPPPPPLPPPPPPLWPDWLPEWPVPPPPPPPGGGIPPGFVIDPPMPPGTSARPQSTGR